MFPLQTQDPGDPHSFWVNPCTCQRVERHENASAECSLPCSLGSRSWLGVYVLRGFRQIALRSSFFSWTVGLMTVSDLILVNSDVRLPLEIISSAPSLIPSLLLATRARSSRAASQDVASSMQQALRSIRPSSQFGHCSRSASVLTDSLSLAGKHSKTRPEVQCICHSHSVYGKAFSALGLDVSRIQFHSAAFAHKLT